MTTYKHADNQDRMFVAAAQGTPPMSRREAQVVG